MKNHYLIFLLLFTTTTLIAQNVSGVVTGENGEALTGASILVKGTATGTVTDLDGKLT